MNMADINGDDNYGDRYLLNLELEELRRKRKEKTLLEKLIEKDEERQEPGKPKEVAEFFAYKLKDLGETIDQLNKEIGTRLEMKQTFDAELDYQINKAAFSLGQFKFWGLGYNTGVDVKRNMLERQLADFRREKRRIELQGWEDIISLRKELREALEEYDSLLRRKNALS
jgi:hypothetical protein